MVQPVAGPEGDSVGRELIRHIQKRCGTCAAPHLHHTRAARLSRLRHLQHDLGRIDLT
ncbi:hypothetical protein BD293_0744 [Roseinatronobacter monicus]|uniref:Uncharacterized protein n=1 Tax=Roseinatronobacter monicus TaxID=393481 RepID=A0A543KAP4_9RHOB|nr:hypothetical protein BD293_0744 [Roseinatronobacter monicus]